MPISGAHAMLYTPEAEKLREVLKEILPGTHVDAGDGWLIFQLPPSEMGVHPADSTHHEISFHCTDIDATMAELSAKGVEFEGDLQRQDWGTMATMVLPGGVKVGLYEPKHAQP